MRTLYGASSGFSRREITDHTLQYLARRFGSWSVFTPPAMYQLFGQRVSPGLYDIISDLLTLEEMQNCKSRLYPPQSFVLKF
jgi:hypothetical protein